MTKGLPNQVCIVENQPGGGGRSLFSQLSTCADSDMDTDVSSTALLNDGPSTSTLSLAATTEIFGADPASGSGDTSTTDLVGPAVDVTTINVGIDTLHLEAQSPAGAHKRPTLEGPPSHLRECPPKERFRVLKEVKMLYPPLTIGWRSGCSWIVVIWGRDIGVFWDFWYVYQWWCLSDNDVVFLKGLHLASDKIFLG
jgi:hypothetical protein